jgi:hypothetical protein
MGSGGTVRVVNIRQATDQDWQSLRFQIIGTVPESFDHPGHGLVGLHIMYRPL